MASKSFVSGMRFRLTTTIAANGMLAPVFITVTGCNDRELPENDCVIIEVPGLCYGGAVDAYATQVGYIAFIKGGGEAEDGTPSAEKKLSKFYLQTVSRRYIQAIRQRYHSCPPGAPVPDSLTSVGWQDGANVQLAALLSDEELIADRELKILRNKHSAAASEAQQPADVCIMFKLLKLYEKSTTTSTTSSSFSLEQSIIQVLRENAAKVSLKSSKLAHVANFASRVPVILTQAATPERIIRGFQEAGLLDPKTRTSPCWQGLLATCKRPLSKEELTLCQKSFPRIMEAQWKYGHVPEELFDELGFRVDQNSKGEAVLRTNVMTNESGHRAKSLSHAWQCLERERLIANSKAVAAEAEARVEQKASAILHENAEAERILKRIINVPEHCDQKELL